MWYPILRSRHDYGHATPPHHSCMSDAQKWVARGIVRVRLCQQSNGQLLYNCLPGRSNSRKPTHLLVVRVLARYVLPYSRRHVRRCRTAAQRHEARSTAETEPERPREQATCAQYSRRKRPDDESKGRQSIVARSRSPGRPINARPPRKSRHIRKRVDGPVTWTLRTGQQAQAGFEDGLRVRASDGSECTRPAS